MSLFGLFVHLPLFLAPDTWHGVGGWASEPGYIGGRGYCGTWILRPMNICRSILFVGAIYRHYELMYYIIMIITLGNLFTKITF